MTLYQSDCLTILREQSSESADVVYLDPPFYTQKRQKLSNAEGREYAFSDVWGSRGEYLEFMRERLTEIRRVLKSTGSVFLHCDSSASHYLRVLLDEIFGEEQFRSEIIWTYKRWTNAAKGLTPGHQTIFFYSKTNDYKFHTFYGEYSPTTNVDQLLQERERNASGKVVYKRGEDGLPTQGRAKKGVPLSDVWEIPYLNPKAKERTGYPTQKPIELLERILRVSSDEGDLILDPFCGSGTTLVSAKLLGRRYLGVDINPDAIAIARQRLDAPFKTTSKLLKLGADAYRTKTPAELAILSQFDCDVVQRNHGIDAFLRQRYNDAPVALRIQRSDEAFADAAALLAAAANRKQCSLSVLVATEPDWRARHSLLPENMVVLDRYDLQLTREIAAFEEKQARKTPRSKTRRRKTRDLLLYAQP